jgi:hypothetical protein
MSSGIRTESSVELRIMPSGDGRWYWEVVTNSRTIVRRGVSDTEPAACQAASTAARDAKLIR